MTLATSGRDGPSSRMVLLKGVDPRGFVFYTNQQSRKGQELDTSRRASLVFFWEPLQRQVRVEGDVERVPEAESDQYYASRPRGSQIGAWVSEQSRVLPGGRAELEARQREMEERYRDEAKPVPRPPHWGGYLVRPTMVEFWQGRSSRLHDRLMYTKHGDSWRIDRLAP